MIHPSTIRRTLAALVVIAAVAPYATAQNTPENAARINALRKDPVVIRGGWLFTATSDTVVRNQGILIVAGRLLAVNRPITAEEAQGARVIQLRDDQYVLPGIFDVHAHYNMTLGPNGLRSDEWTYNPLIFLANGVTSTFPAGEYEPDSMMAARKRIDDGQQIGPRIYNSGPYFGTARRGWNQNATAADIDRDVDARRYRIEGLQGHRRALHLSSRDVRPDDHRTGILHTARGGLRLLDR